MFLFISIVSLVVVPLLINKTTERHFDWVKPYLRQAWCAVALAYVMYFLTTETAKQLLMSWRNGFGNAHPVLAFVVPAIVGAMVAPAYWWLMGKLLSSDSGTAKLKGKSTSPKLVIHRAVYPAGLPTEVLVTDQLQNAVRDALVVIVDSTLGGLLTRDPAFNVRKRLDVDYSYGSDTLFHVSRTERPPGEICRLLLPEDSEVQRLTDEVTSTKQKTADQIALTKQLEVDLFRCRQIRDGALAELRTATLEIRPLPSEGLQSFREPRGYTHYRMEIYNSETETAHNVQVKLVGIEPTPICQQFCADFPYVVRLAHLEGETDASVSHDINAGTSQSFELLFSWESSDHRIMVDGIDTKHALSRDARFSIEDKECWHLNYEVSSSWNGIQRPIFFVRREGESLFMSRLV